MLQPGLNLSERPIQLYTGFKSVRIWVSSAEGIAFGGAEMKKTQKKYLLFKRKEESYHLSPMEWDGVNGVNGLEGGTNVTSDRG